MKGKSLRARMVLYTVFTTGLALLLTGFGLTFYDTTYLREQSQEQLAAESEVIRRVCEPVIIDRDPDKAQDIAEAISLDRHMVTVAIYTADGQLLASQGELDPKLQLPQEVNPVKAISASTGRYTTIFQPIVGEGAVLGWVYLKHDFSEITDRRKRYIGILAGILGISLLLTLATSTWLQTGFVKPVRDLVNTANRVSLEKDYSLRVTKMTEDELGQLTDAFNLMLEKVQRRDLDLQDSERRLYR